MSEDAGLRAVSPIHLKAISVNSFTTHPGQAALLSTKGATDDHFPGVMVSKMRISLSPLIT